MALLQYSVAMVVGMIIFVSVAAVLPELSLLWRRSSHRMAAPPQRTNSEAVIYAATTAVSALRAGMSADTAVRAFPALRRL
jgi:hypothetical protein